MAPGDRAIPHCCKDNSRGCIEIQSCKGGSCREADRDDVLELTIKGLKLVLRCPFVFTSMDVDVSFVLQR